jgi:hypothetical protein
MLSDVRDIVIFWFNVGAHQSIGKERIEHKEDVDENAIGKLERE